jgi:hypothetical protein
MSGIDYAYNNKNNVGPVPHTDSTVVMAGAMALVERHAPGGLRRVSQEIDQHDGRATWIFGFAHLGFHLEFAQQPGSRLRIESTKLSDSKMCIPRKQLDAVRCELRQLLPQATAHKPTGLAVATLQCLETISFLESAITATLPAAAWSAASFNSWDDLLHNSLGLDAASIPDTAVAFLGITPVDIAAAIPPAWRVLHIESVLRPDLTSRFRAYQRRLEADLAALTTAELRRKLPPHSALAGRMLASLSRDDVLADLVRPRVTYHGTRLRNVGSIVRHGFALPGTLVGGSVVASPRSGAVYAGGVYSSQSAAYALSYAAGQRQTTPLGDLPSLRLFVCATLMGRTLSGAAGPRSAAIHGPLAEGYDAHFDGGCEYIVHRVEGMLPCYVVHLDLGSEAARRAVEEVQADPWAYYTPWPARAAAAHPKLVRGGQASPGDEAREKAARKAAAQKWFPYGFGSAKGTAFVIEEIGEVDDDEEDYGMWQADKHAFIGERVVLVEEEEEERMDWMQEGDNRCFLDQYQADVMAYVKRPKVVR